MQTLITHYLITTLAVQAYLQGVFIITLIVVLFHSVQILRRRFHRMNRNDRRTTARPRSRVFKEKCIEEYLDHANFSNEGNPNCGWQKNFSEWNVK